jgi:hypothetical protein
VTRPSARTLAVQIATIQTSRLRIDTQTNEVEQEQHQRHREWQKTGADDDNVMGVGADAGGNMLTTVARPGARKQRLPGLEDQARAIGHSYIINDGCGF